MEQQVLDEILKDTYTLETFKKRYQALKETLQVQIFDSKEKNEDYKAEDEWVGKFDKKLLSQISSNSLSGISRYIDKYLSSLNILSIYFVFMPDPGQTKEIGEWIRSNLKNPGLIYDVKIDTSLIGGCAMVYKGIYKDYSLKAKIARGKPALLGEFKKYLKL